MTERSEAHRAAEQAARTSYGRLLAILASRSRDIARAEDALSDSFAAALRVWPERGVPANPDAWLLTSARNALVNMARHDKVRHSSVTDIERHYDELSEGDRPFADERLKLLFVSAHPAIDAGIRTALMLQTVLGLDAARIAQAFLVQPSTMGQRLVRAKTRIRDAGIRFDIPDTDELPGRLADVLDAVYAAFGTGWDLVTGPETALKGLPQEAIYLGRLLVDLLPTEPEPKGLLSLMLHASARQQARRDSEGRFVPLARQDPGLWNRDMIIEAEGLLVTAARSGRFGRYQCEAAIQSVHAQRAITGTVNLQALSTLYAMLAAHDPTIGVLVAQASVRIEMGDPAAGLAILDGLDRSATDNYQPFWVTLAHGLRRTGALDAARQATARAIALTDDASIRTWLATDGDDDGRS